MFSLLGEYKIDYSDLAIMLYYYNTHRKPVKAVDYESGITGYSGVLQELISEVPLRGSDRLQRKLSVDISRLIPKMVEDPDKRQRMIYIASDIAAQYNLTLQAPTVKIRRPLFEREYVDGCQWRGWIALFKAFFTSYPRSEPEKARLQTEAIHQ